MHKGFPAEETETIHHMLHNKIKHIIWIAIDYELESPVYQLGLLQTFMPRLFYKRQRLICLRRDAVP